MQSYTVNTSKLINECYNTFDAKTYKDAIFHNKMHKVQFHCGASMSYCKINIFYIFCKTM